MRLARRWRLARHGAGVLLALLGGLLLAPSARASCGDYVTVGDRAADHVTLPGAPAHAPHLPANRHAPCSGPNCSRHPLSAPLVPVSPAPVREPWGCAAPLARPPEAEAVGAVSDDVAGCPVRRARTVYHPPR